MIEQAWKVHYGDGSSFSNRDGDPSTSPGLNVQVIAQPNQEVGRELLCRKDYYWFESGSWYGGDISGLWQYLRIARVDFTINIFELFEQLKSSGLVKFGTTIPNDRFQEVYHLARDDIGLPAKSGYLPNEGRPD